MIASSSPCKSNSFKNIEMNNAQEMLPSTAIVIASIADK